VLLFAEVCDVEAVLPTVVFDMEAPVLEEGINVEIEDVAELTELEVPAPCSAKMVPKVGTKVVMARASRGSAVVWRYCHIR
jgi:hypothetical protein